MRSQPALSANHGRKFENSKEMPRKLHLAKDTQSLPEMGGSKPFPTWRCVQPARVPSRINATVEGYHVRLELFYGSLTLSGR